MIREGLVCMKTIYILFLGGYDPMSWIIKMVTKAPYVHSILALDSKLTELYSYNLKIRIKNRRLSYQNGFIVEQIDQYQKNLPYWLYRVKVTNQQYKKIAKLIYYFKNNPDVTSYHIKGALGFMFPILWKHVNKRKKYTFTCSEFIAYMLQTSHVVSFDKPIYQISPKDIIQTNKLKFLGNGKIGNLSNRGDIIVLGIILLLIRHFLIIWQGQTNQSRNN